MLYEILPRISPITYSTFLSHLTTHLASYTGGDKKLAPLPLLTSVYQAELVIRPVCLPSSSHKPSPMAEWLPE